MAYNGNPFSKSGGQPLTPAQVSLQQVTSQQAQKNATFWAPIRQYFAQRVSADAPAKTEFARGKAAATGRTAGDAQAMGMAEHDAQTGAGVGSGKYLSDSSRGFQTAATNAALGADTAQAQGDQAYLKGLQEVVTAGKGAQQSAIKGLSTAASEQAQEEGAQAQGNASNQAGLTSAVGLVAEIA